VPGSDGCCRPSPGKVATPRSQDHFYNPRPGEPVGLLPDPAELCDSPRFPTREAVELHLFDGFLPAAYRRHPDPGRRCPWAPEAAQRWLVFLARHLEHTMRSTDLAWWQLTSAAPRGVLAWGCGLALALLIGVVYGLTSGLTFGCAVGRRPDPGPCDQGEGR
jgi:hypothetical protein